MNIKNLIFEALDKSSRDISIEDGVFDISKQEHIEILRCNLLEVGMSVEAVTAYLNNVAEGKYPERQAYNKNGILVTFPTPEYKQRAIERGTHFEKDPTKGKSNIFPGQSQGGEQAPQPASPEQPEENLLYFFEKYSPDIQIWQGEILRIVRKIAQYFYPQGQTKVMNEGFASLTHWEIMNRLHEKGLTTNGAHLEFLALHTNVLYQPDFNSRHYSGINPYAFGFAILRDIQRMCSEPTAEDKKWFPQITGANARELILDAVANYRDESFIRQWLSPKVIRDWRLFSLHDDKSNEDEYTVSNIHNERGYHDIREKLADQYLRAASVPHIEVVEVSKKTKTLNLRYTSHRGRKLGNTEKLIPHIFRLWGDYPVIIKDQDGNLLSFKQN